MKTTKRLLALFLCLFMLVGMVPVETFATDEEHSHETAATESVTTEVEETGEEAVTDTSEEAEPAAEEETDSSEEAEPAAEEET